MTFQQHTPAPRAGGFTFKQFFVAHDRCAMKVGTDGVLLGAWAPLHKETRILDIGCGSGLVALMLAQRSGGRTPVDGVELDTAASAQASDNAALSPWADYIRIYQADIAAYAQAATARYSLIVSNPPYFSVGVDCASAQRAQARYTTTLTHDALLDCASRLLESGGRFCVVLPLQVADSFLRLAQQLAWYADIWVDVADSPARPVNRVLLSLRRHAVALTRASLIIRDDNRHYSASFQALTRDFYLSM
ncbi:tRNA(1)(Val) (adenine(37)-N(6))-methyltransferase TrmN [Dickeya poaceiphila]|uniref:tRNA1(Val) (adenine(37)-N6)-methyltransferase n=1 Tax=Dickeya poaceiphila TaxID=568768 RepID=A0A5B8HIN8_9GAMM|nr:methyltransferase [Dickeya poaceiphila]QDX29169.1 methyltransferase [Dickeya poaceiphila]